MLFAIPVERACMLKTLLSGTVETIVTVTTAPSVPKLEFSRPRWTQ